MLFLRTEDTVKIQGINEIVTFETHNRKGNNILKVKLNGNKLSFNVSELYTKMIPKSDKELFENLETKMLITKFGELIFQDPNNCCHFLVFDEDDGAIKPTTFNDLTEDDSILFYDPPNDYVLGEIQDLYVAEEMNQRLSNYILYSENEGIIINDIFVI